MIDKSKLVTGILITLTTVSILAVFAFYQNMQIFKAKTDLDIVTIKIEVEKKADKEMQEELKRQLNKIDEKLDKIIENYSNGRKSNG